mmetsp:Transcript_24508/g.39273  ORF Transcript_24508/g.39273 Transcript_24508/m.39273 type:complete len:338 (+) Transcript_24508:81-1094(+)
MIEAILSRKITDRGVSSRCDLRAILTTASLACETTMSAIPVAMSSRVRSKLISSSIVNGATASATTGISTESSESSSESLCIFMTSAASGLCETLLLGDFCESSAAAAIRRLTILSLSGETLPSDVAFGEDGFEIGLSSSLSGSFAVSVVPGDFGEVEPEPKMPSGEKLPPAPLFKPRPIPATGPPVSPIPPSPVIEPPLSPMPPIPVIELPASPMPPIPVIEPPTSPMPPSPVMEPPVRPIPPSPIPPIPVTGPPVKPSPIPVIPLPPSPIPAIGLPPSPIPVIPLPIPGSELIDVPTTPPTKPVLVCFPTGLTADSVLTEGSVALTASAVLLASC